MHEPPVNLKSLFVTFIISIFIVLILFILQVGDNRTKIVFCDVGQGDAAYIRIRNRFDLLIDAGPDKNVLQCLGKYMPFWDKRIELAFITHQDLDHYGGFPYIIDRYRMGRVVAVDKKSSSKSYNKLKQKIQTHNIPFQFNSSGDKIFVLDSQILFFWPKTDLKSSEDNEYSLVFLFREKSFKILFTGDVAPMALQKLVRENSEKDLFDLKNVNVLKVPHHGSSNGLTANFLKLANPRVAVISVGKNNPYGHPTKQILDLLEAKNIQIKRTDKDGDIKFILEE